MALDPRGMGEAIVRNLPARTGRSLQQWLDLLAQDGPADAREQVAWLQRTHGLGRVTAQVVVGHAGGRDVLDVAAYDAPDTLVAGLFGPPGSALRLRYEALRAEIEAAVPGARVTACKGYVGFSARRQFAAVRPRRGGLELGLRPGGVEVPGEAPVKGLGGGGLTRAVLVDTADGRPPAAVLAAIVDAAR